MEIQVTTRNMKLDTENQDYAEQKLGKLHKYLNTISTIKLELVDERSKTRPIYTAQVTININGFLLRGEHKGDSIRSAVDDVFEVMERLVTKYKKRYEINKGREPESIRRLDIEEEKKVVDKSRVAKSKSFLVKPMTTSQAIDQMEFIGHDFFIFLNAKDSSVNVVYRRKDGKYGLIQPQFS
ncbi:MAG: ribosome-associated translation inhibitor RaiA [Dehalococcoidia bacterium]|jgi:putative sigma-54 modulation protein